MNTFARLVAWQRSGGGTAAPWSDAQAKLPDDLLDVLRVANGDERALSVAIAITGEPRKSLQSVALRFIREVLLARDASHYRKLGVAADAPIARIRKHYRELIAIFHPDRLHDDAPAGDAARATIVNEAYNVLKRPHARAEYDRERSAAADEAKPAAAAPPPRQTDAPGETPRPVRRPPGWRVERPPSAVRVWLRSRSPTALKGMAVGSLLLAVAAIVVTTIERPSPSVVATAGDHVRADGSVDATGGMAAALSRDTPLSGLVDGDGAARGRAPIRAAHPGVAPLPASVDANGVRQLGSVPPVSVIGPTSAREPPTRDESRAAPVSNGSREVALVTVSMAATHLAATGAPDMPKAPAAHATLPQSTVVQAAPPPVVAVVPRQGDARPAATTVVASAPPTLRIAVAGPPMPLERGALAVAPPAVAPMPGRATTAPPSSTQPSPPETPAIVGAPPDRAAATAPVGVDRGSAAPVRATVAPPSVIEVDAVVARFATAFDAGDLAALLALVDPEAAQGDHIVFTFANFSRVFRESAARRIELRILQRTGEQESSRVQLAARTTVSGRDEVARTGEGELLLVMRKRGGVPMITDIRYVERVSIARAL